MSPQVCFVALNAYPAIDPDVPGVFGGIETRAWLFARGLARETEIDVSFIVRHWQLLRREAYDGVRLHLLRDRLYPWRDSVLSRLERRGVLPWLRQPRLTDLVAVPLLAANKLIRRRPDPLQPNPYYTRIPADLFLTFGVQSNSASVIASAHAGGRPAVLFLGSDSDLDERYAEDADFVSVYRDRSDVCRWVLQNADHILCQTEAQRTLLKTRFKRDATVIRNPIDVEHWDDLQTRPLELPLAADWPRYALWIGRADPEHKRPQALIELARKCPDVPFLMVMNPRDDLLERTIRLQAPRNVRILERVAFSAMPALFARAGLLVNTSSLEGFPNTFLQAAVSRVPIASLNVEGGFLRVSLGGFCSDGNLDALARFIRETWSAACVDNDPWPAREYVKEYHALPAQVRLLANTLEACVRPSTS